MSDELLSAAEAARRLGLAVATIYGRLGRSDAGLLVLRGRPVTIRYYQGGARGQGRIRLDVAEVERLRELLRVHPQPARPPRTPHRRDAFPGIHVPLGLPPTTPFR